MGVNRSELIPPEYSLCVATPFLGLRVILFSTDRGDLKQITDFSLATIWPHELRLWFTMKISRGVYFLANDRVYDLVIAFLNSFRKYNPDLPLCLIPFDNRCERLAAIAGNYNFNVFINAEALAKCDAWSASFHGHTMGQYRKLVAWQGQFEEFIYIDIDTIVMQSITSVFKELNGYSVVTGHSHIEGSRKFVWKDSIQQTHLSDEEINYSANTGFILSKRGVLTFDMIDNLIEEGIRLRPHMELMCVEQPFLNLIFFRATGSYTSLYKIGLDSSRVEMPLECWAGDPAWKLQVDGVCTFYGEPKNVLFVHWAGEWAPLNSESALPNSCVRTNMKNGHIWNHYRSIGVANSQEAEN